MGLPRDSRDRVIAAVRRDAESRGLTLDRARRLLKRGQQQPAAVA